MTKKLFSPPHKFKGAKDVVWAGISGCAPWFAKRVYRQGARGAGMAYERKAQLYLEKKYPDTYVYAPWIRFEERGKHTERWCQPDGLIIDLLAQRLVIIEIKLNHTVQAWYQLFQLYRPVVDTLFEGRLKISCCEVTKWFDRGLSCPVSPLLSRDPFTPEGDEFGVHIYAP